MSKAREIAINVIEKVLLGSSLQETLDNTLNKENLKKVDKALITTLCYGYIRLKKRIDYVIKRTLKGSIKKLPQRLKIALGCGIYEILYLEKIPEYATVYTYVEYCKKKISNRLSGLTNAILRHVTRIKEELLCEDFYKNGDFISFLSRYYSCPMWIIELWMRSYGEDVCVNLLKRSTEPSKIGIRINPKSKEAEEVFEYLKSQSPLIYQEGLGFLFERSFPVVLDELERKGVITRQSFEAQKITWDLEPQKWPFPIWDCCCGAGLKTTLLLERGVEDLFASDINLRRLFFLKKELKRLNLKAIPIFLADAKSFCPKNKPSTIFIDAPCSGLGVLSRRPDVKWKRRPDDLKRLASLQKEFLSKALSIVPLGGRVVYITCTINPEENENLIRSLSGVDIVKEIGVKDLLRNPFFNDFFYAAVLKKVRS